MTPTPNETWLGFTRCTDIGHRRYQRPGETPHAVGNAGKLHHFRSAPPPRREMFAWRRERMQRRPRHNPIPILTDLGRPRDLVDIVESRRHRIVEEVSAPADLNLPDVRSPRCALWCAPLD